LLDAGNSLTGDAEPAKGTKGVSSVEAMNLMRYDAMTLGSGDLALGFKTLKQRQAEARFKFLSANVYVKETGQLFASAYMTHEVNGLRVAFVGLTDKGDAKVPPELKVTDPVSATMQLLPELRKSVDFVVLLSHAGRPVDQRIAAQVAGIDWIIAGGEPASTPKPIVDKKTKVVIVQADHATPNHAGRFIGIASLAFDANRRLSKGNWRVVTLGPDVKSDPELNKFVLRWK
jgi:5'-nucleotidase